MGVAQAYFLKDRLVGTFGYRKDRLKNGVGVAFRDPSRLDIVGIYPNYAEAHKAWKAAAQRTVDNAHMRYFIVHMHRLLDPETGQEQG